MCREALKANRVATFSVSYVYTLVDAFTPGAARMAAAAASIKASAAGAGAAVVSLGRAMAVASAAAGAGALMMITSGVAAAAKFEDKMAEVRKVVPDMTKESMWKLGDDVLRLSAKTAVTAENVADIYAAGARMGIRGDAALGTFADTVVKVAAAWDGVSATLAGESLGTIAGKFFGDFSQEDAQKKMIGVADAINYLAQNTAGVKNIELLKFFQNAGGDFNKVKISAEEAAAYGAVAMKTGQPSGLNEGTRASSTINRLVLASTAALKSKKGLTKAGKAFGELGMSQQEWVKQIDGGGTDALLSLMERVQDMPVTKRTRVLADILGDARAARQVSNVAGQLNEYKRALAQVSDKYAQRFLNEKGFMDWMRKAYPAQAALLEQTGKALHNGSVDQEFKARMDTMVKQADRVGRAWDWLLINLGRPVLPMLSDMFSGLADSLSSLATAAGQNQSAIKYLFSGALWAGAGAIGYGALSLIGYLTGVGGALAALKAIGMVTLKFSVIAIGLATAYWLYDNWAKVKQTLSDPIKVDILFPELPEWLRNFIASGADPSRSVLDPGTKYLHGMSLPLNGYDPSHGSLAALSATAEQARVNAEAVAQAMSPHQMLNMAQAPDTTWWQRNVSGVSPEWGAQPFNAASIPQSMSVDVRVDPVTFNPATINVNVTGTVNGSVNGTGSGELQANPARGTSSAEAGAPAGAR